MLKFYVSSDIDRSIDYGEDLLVKLEDILPKSELTDLRFTLGTSYAL